MPFGDKRANIPRLRMHSKRSVRQFAAVTFCFVGRQCVMASHLSKMTVFNVHDISGFLCLRSDIG